MTEVRKNGDGQVLGPRTERRSYDEQTLGVRAPAAAPVHRVRSKAALFSRASDLWATPRWLFDELDDEFAFDMDAAATADTALCPIYRGPDHPIRENRNGLVCDWAPRTFVNPPFSQVGAFIAKAAEEAAKGRTVVALVPSRTDTRWWHAHVWDAARHRSRPGVELRFRKGRLKFGDSKNSAPFPSVVLVMRPRRAARR
jgi:site-specific DNA-methyltransferase (adenine-specific)